MYRFDDQTLSLLYVSRALHYETAFLPYKHIKFTFLAGSHLSSWCQLLRRFLKKRSRAQIEALSDMNFYYWNRENQTWDEISGNGAYWMARLGIAEPSH